MERITISKKYDNKNISFEYGKFVKKLGIQLKEQTNNRYLLNNSSYLSEMSESIFTLFSENLISKEELNRIIIDLDNKVRNEIKDNPSQIKYKYKKLSELYPKRNLKKRQEIEKKIFAEVEDMYYNKNMKQIDIARTLQIEPKSINHIISKIKREQ